MIGYLHGTIIRSGDDHIVIDVSGVGYLVFVSEQILTKYPEKSETELFIHTSVSERDIQLFGFETRNELAFFKMLLNVNGIGPKSALAILNSPYEEVAAAIVGENEFYLGQLPGIGKKTASRMIIELKSKLQEKGFEATSSYNHIPVEALNALVELGYTKKEAAERLKDIDTQQPIEVIIKEALH